MSLVDSLWNECTCANWSLSEILVDNISNVASLKLLIWDVIISCEINRIADVHICCNTCISIVEGILIDPSVAVVEISTGRETCVHHATHVIVEIVDIVWVVIHAIHAVHIVEIHVILVLVEVVVDVILVLILVVLIALIALISLFWIIIVIVVVIATCRVTRITVWVSILS